jgi:hypothetical protein
MVPKSFYFEFLWLFLLDMFKFLEEKRLIRLLFFWSKVCQLALEKKATNHTKELLGKQWHKVTIFRGEKWVFLKCYFIFCPITNLVKSYFGGWLIQPLPIFKK